MFKDFGAVVEFVPPGNYGRVALAAIKALLQWLGIGRDGNFPGPGNNKRALIALIFILWVASLIVLAWFRSHLSFTISTLALMFVISGVPLIGTQLRRRSLRVITETLIVLTSIALFTWTQFGRGSIGGWFIYSAAVVLILEIGGHLVEWIRNSAVARLSQWTDLVNPLHNNTLVIEGIFRRQQISYAAVPLGFLLGLSIGLLLNYSEQRIALIVLLAILTIASIILAYFLINSFIKMSEPMFSREQIPQPTVAVTNVRTKNNELRTVFGGLTVTITSPSVKAEEADTRDVDLSKAATSLREIYLYDSIHNVLLLVAFSAVAANLFNARITLIGVTIALAVFTFLFSQLPFAIGQARLRREVLWPFRGSKEIEVNEKLDKVAPFFPVFQLITTLISTGGGALLYFLLKEATEGRLKLLVA